MKTYVISQTAIARTAIKVMVLVVHARRTFGAISVTVHVKLKIVLDCLSVRKKMDQYATIAYKGVGEKRADIIAQLVV